MPAQSPQRQRLRSFMEARCEELGLTWTEVAAAGGSSVKTLHSVRTEDHRIQPATRRAIETGLRWAPGSVQETEAGRDPVPLEGAPVPAGGTPLRPAGPAPRREYALAGDPDLEPFIATVREDLGRAMTLFGPGFTGRQAFSAAHEAETWDDPDGLLPDDGDRARLIARNRRRAAGWQSEERRISLWRT